MPLPGGGKAGFDRFLLPGYSGHMTLSRTAPSAHAGRFLRSPANVAGVLLIVIFALLYGVTLDNGLRPGELEGGDLITHQYAQVQARFSNAPGYPLYTMGGWLWFRIGRLLCGPDANPIPILSSYSTLWALVALGLLYVLILEVIRKPGFSEKAGFWEVWPFAFLAVAFYGVTYFFWYYSVTAEQYTSSVAWTLAAVLFAFRWERTWRDRYLLGLALLIGIGLAHQVTVLAVIPPILWLVLSRRPDLRRKRLIAGAVGLALLPLLSYAYVYVRGAQHPEWRGAGQWASTWQWFWAFVSTAQGRSELTWSATPLFTAEFPALIWREMTWPGLAAGLLGWLTLGRRRAILLYATLAIYLGFCWIDRLGNWYQVIMPVYALLVVGLAAAAAYIVRTRWVDAYAMHGDTNVGNVPSGIEPSGGLVGVPPAKASIPAPQRSILRAVVILFLLALIAYRGIVSYPRADASNRPEDTGLAPAWAILADDPPYGAGVLGVQTEMLALNYVTDVWGRRPDLTALTTVQARARAAGSGFAVTEAALPLVAAEISPSVRYSALGRTLIAVRTEPNRTVPPDLAPWTHDFAGQVQLAGGRIRENGAAGERVVFLAWQASAPLAEDWSVSVRLMQGDVVLAQFDRQHPVFGAYPMTRWSAGEVVVDAYPFAPTSDGPADGVAVVLYRRAADGSFVNLDSARFEINR